MNTSILSGSLAESDEPRLGEASILVRAIVQNLQGGSVGILTISQPEGLRYQEIIRANESSETADLTVESEV